VLYSGNADGSDMHFQIGSRGRYVTFLPWQGFNQDHYNFEVGDGCLAALLRGQSDDGEKYLKFTPEAVKESTKKFMRRNAHQVIGDRIKGWPQVSFVLCCATPCKDKIVEGGTGHAVRIATHLKIPVLNIRVPGWEARLSLLVSQLVGRTANFKASLK